MSFFASCVAEEQSMYKKSRMLMDTFVTITVVSGSADEADEAIEKAFSAIERFGALINFFSDKSEVAEINRKAGMSEVRVSPATIDIVERAVYVAAKSGGAFDPTIGPVTKLWDFTKKKKPSGVRIRNNLRLVNYQNIIINRDKQTVFLKEKDMLLDLGGIAKGYAADLAVINLQQNGIKSGLVAVAGDIRGFGSRPDGGEWKIGVKNPRQRNGSDEIIARISLSNKAVSTSGDYERYFFINGRRFHHLLDPKTGYPAECCRSVSMIADEGVFADGFSTAVFILGPEKGLELVQALGMDAIIIDNNGKIHATPGLEGRFEIEENH